MVAATKHRLKRRLLPQPMQEITPTELKAKIDRGDDFTLVDVREPYEYEIGKIPGSKLIPLGTIASRSGELDPDKEIVLQCRSGARSAQALEILQRAGLQETGELERRHPRLVRRRRPKRAQVLAIYHQDRGLLLGPDLFPKFKLFHIV